MEQSNNIERAFLARVFFRRPDEKTIAASFVEAKNLGANAEWFDEPICKIIWEAAEELFSQTGFDKINLFRLNKKATAIAAESKEKDVKGLVVKLEFYEAAEKIVKESDSLEDYCSLLQNAAIERKFFEAVEVAHEAFKTGNQDARAIVAQFTSSSQGILKCESIGNKVSIASTVDEVIANYTDIYHHRVELGEEDYTPGLPLPWTKLAYTLNGFGPVLTILAARPGVGKTSFAVELIRYWLDNGIKVVLNSLDMAAPELMKRQLAEISQISSRRMQFARSNDFQKDITAIKEAGNVLKKLEEEGRYTLYTEPDIDLLRANVKLLKDQGLIDVLVVDYIQIMKTKSRKAQGKKDEVSYVSNQLHAIATELKIPVLALSQINRDSSKLGKDEVPQLHNIKDSGDIEQDAANVIIIHPNFKLKMTWETNPPIHLLPAGEFATKTLMPVTLIVAKARDGDSNIELPFLQLQNKHSWYLANYGENNDKRWEHVYPNWKHDDIEKTWEKNGALITLQNQTIKS